MYKQSTMVPVETSRNRSVRLNAKLLWSAIALLAWIAIQYPLGRMVARFPTYGIIAIIAMIGGLTVLYFTISSRKFILFIWLLLVTKPLIDLTWRWRFGSIAGQRLNPQTLVAVFAIILIGISVILRRRGLIKSRAILLFLFSTSLSVVILGLIHSISSMAAGINELVRLFSGVFIFFVAGAILNTEQKFNRFASYFLLSTSVPVLLSFLQRLGYLEFEYWDWIGGSQIGRVSGTYQHPLNLVFFLVYSIPIALYFSTKPLSHKRRLWLWAFIGLSLIALMLTIHRTALVAVGLQMWLWMVLTKRYKQAALFFVLGVVLLVWQRERIQFLYVDLQSLIQGNISPSFMRGRWANWQAFLRSYASAPPFLWLIGRGLSDASSFLASDYVLSAREPHNDFIRILHAYGLVGLGLYLIILRSFLRIGLKLRHVPDQFSRSLGNLMLVVLLGILLLSITTEPMRYPSGVWYLFILGSVITVRYRQIRRACSGRTEAQELNVMNKT